MKTLQYRPVVETTHSTESAMYRGPAAGVCPSIVGQLTSLNNDQALSLQAPPYNTRGSAT